METLVLNAGYQPLARVSWRRAVTLLFAGKVEVVDEYLDREVRSVSFSIRMPSVVRFLRALVGGPRGVKLSRENVYARDGGRCRYCARRVTRAEATWDHIVPRAQGGRTRWDNIAIACLACNQQKGGRTPAEARMRLRAPLIKGARPQESLRVTLGFCQGMPVAWRQWLRDFAYWNAALEDDSDGD